MSLIFLYQFMKKYKVNNTKILKKKERIVVDCRLPTLLK